VSGHVAFSTAAASLATLHGSWGTAPAVWYIHVVVEGAPQLLCAVHAVDRVPALHLSPAAGCWVSTTGGAGERGLYMVASKAWDDAAGTPQQDEGSTRSFMFCPWSCDAPGYHANGRCTSHVAALGS
jgi:hypothetical protein